MPPGQIARLLQHVYGPYPENVILNDNFPRQGFKPPLRLLQLYSGKESIGFDQSEYIIKPPENSRVEDIVFFGVLEILELDWLSEQGLPYLERDFQEYDEKIHLSRCRSTLRALYGQRKGEGSHLKIRIKCNKHLLAHFLTTDSDPDKLLIYSQSTGTEGTIQRAFSVETLHPSTLNMSTNFLERFRLRALIKELIDTDENCTPLKNRNIEWLIHRYYTEIYPRDSDRARKIQDSRLDLDVYEEPKHLRHIPRAEIRGYFATHAKWLLAHQIASASSATSLLDIRQWIAFCDEASRDSMDAKKHGVHWGIPKGQQVEVNSTYDLAKDLAKFGCNVKFWETKLKAARKSKPKRKKEISPEIVPVTPPPIKFQYDSDFSDPSTPGASDIEDEVPLNHSIPKFCLAPPQIPTGRFTWACPGCYYKIDLLNLSEENLGALPNDAIPVLTGKSWKIHDGPVQRALFLMVSNHYRKAHIIPNGIDIIQNGNTWQLRNLHPPEEPRKMKLEENVQEIKDSLRRSSRIPVPRRTSDIG
ncbi:hypothetical protein M413DRAFT_441477 [Hebeloma cylindrosporum]|uniref:Uncharacterized protein n=1 Tax=Hebeloma cylindrosporum TaxID=76867 RepID=A0A0C3CQK5_HEBCY|nr:hypothetical protein M413DRAFT_441477 [Hebeloma cylindrosporum h7]